MYPSIKLTHAVNNMSKKRRSHSKLVRYYVYSLLVWREVRLDRKLFPTTQDLVV